MEQIEAMTPVIIYKNENQIAWLKFESTGDLLIVSESVGGDRIITICLDSQRFILDIFLDDCQKNTIIQENFKNILLDYFKRKFGGKSINPFDEIKTLLNENKVAYQYSYWPNR